MLGFLWWVTGSAELKASAETDGRLLRKIGNYLEAEKRPRRKVEIGLDYVEFSETLSQPSRSWSALALFERGRIFIDRRGEKARLRYRLRRFSVFVFSIFAGVVAAGFTALDPKWDPLKVGVGAFLWLYGTNALISFVRVPLLFRKWAKAQEDERDRTPRALVTDYSAEGDAAA